MSKKPGRRPRTRLAGPRTPGEYPWFTINKHKLDDPKWWARMYLPASDGDRRHSEVPGNGSSSGHSDSGSW
jgi:hypothetical protein